MPDDNRSQYRQLLEMATLGMVFPVAIGLGFLLGRGMDSWFNSYPWCTGIMTAVGVAAGFANLFRAGTKNDGSGTGTGGT